MRASWLVALALLAGRARADEEPAATPAVHVPSGGLGDQLAQQQDAIERALTMVTDKLATADAARLSRLRAAYRAIAPADDLMTSARRRAAARLLLDRDLAERTLLADEATRLHTARDRTIEATTKLPMLALPSDLAWPAHGKGRGSVQIERTFGELVHERSKATLSRRGVDLEVDEHAVATAPADGVVRYAGPIRGLEHGVIIDHGDFVTVIAKLGELSLPIGTHLERGDRIGRAARHRVYFEVRVKVGPGGLPIDPETAVATKHATVPDSDQPRSGTHSAPR